MSHTSTGEGKSRHICVTKISPVDIDRLQAKDEAIPEGSIASTGISDPNTCLDASRGIDLRDIEIAEKENKFDGSALAQNAVGNTEEHSNTTSLGSANVLPNHELKYFCESKIGSHTSSKEQEQNAEPSNLSKSGAISNKPEPLSSLSNDGGEKMNEQAIEENTSVCPFCQKLIPSNNKTVHELHCYRQSRSSNAPASNGMRHSGSAGGGECGKGARKKQNVKKQESQPAKEKKEKTKPKVSQVQKASEVLSKIADDDFDALISSITALDGKCAFRKCKTLTTTLGRQCNLCDRRFCLAHLTPEIHGCGQAAKDQARRIISREGVLHSGSGVPDKKPNAARRSQLEHRMEKKKEELAKARARQTDKKKS